MTDPLISHFAINADEPDRARRFYEQTFGWSLQPWGPPGFFRDSRTPVVAVVQQRRSLIDTPSQGFECTVAVDDLGVVMRRAVAAGGRVVLDPTVIDGVGELVWLQDTEGHVVGAMRYER
ncbi:MAG: VOC family protein [Acidimicrobiales bacterium]